MKKPIHVNTKNRVVTQKAPYDPVKGILRGEDRELTNKDKLMAKRHKEKRNRPAVPASGTKLKRPKK